VIVSIPSLGVAGDLWFHVGQGPEQ
jgi:hypothetical protein